MTTTNTFVGIGDEQRISSRVLKPPGGGSSIVFDEDDSMKSPPQPQQQSPQVQAPASPEHQEAPQAEQQQERPIPKPESNGMSTPDCVKEDAAATRDSNTSPAATTNGQRSPALNGPPAVNGSSTNGSMSSGSTSSMSMYSGGTPKHLNTQTRIFGNEQGAPTPRRRLRDHERSNIFSDDASSNGTHRPADVSSGSCTSEGTPEPRMPDQSQQAQRQRVPPGGFSTKLW